MSSSGDDLIKKHLVSFRDNPPDYSLLDPDVYKEAEDYLAMTLFKVWRQGQIMDKAYRRRTYFYRPPNWLLIFALGPTTQARAYMNKTLKTMIRIQEDRAARRTLRK